MTAADELAPLFHRYTQAKTTDELVQEWMLESARNGEINRMHEEWLRAQQPRIEEVQSDIDELTSRYSAQVAKREALQEKVAQYMLDGDDLLLETACKAMAKLGGEIERIEARLKGLQDARQHLERNTSLSIPDWTFGDLLQGYLDRGDREVVKTLLRTYIGKVDVRVDRYVVHIWGYRWDRVEVRRLNRADMGMSPEAALTLVFDWGCIPPVRGTKVV